MIATFENETSDNHIIGCTLKNINHNIYLLKGFGGKFLNNFVENNLIEGANNGVWMDNGGGSSFGKNTISKNVFVANGSGAGYGLFLAQDSTIVTNNIFWKNHIAIFYKPFTVGSKVSNNSIYWNDNGIALSEGSAANEFFNNTFSMNLHSFFDIGEMNGTIFDRNNIFAGYGQEKIIINHIPDDISIDLNYWNTFSETEIQKLIWDKNDDPALGLVNYYPFLAEADTTNPISPPLSAIRQLVDGQVKLSWLDNPEKDLRTYKIHYGGFKNYSFPESIETGPDTVYFSTVIDINDSIAVTALDAATSNPAAQVLGHESPFAFAILYPYAGEDDEVCNNQNGFQTTGVTIPFEYQSINWSTGGDGTFSETDILSPVYYPGLADMQIGKVVLTLGVEQTNEIKLYDSLTLYVYNEPVVFAGNDTTIFADSQLDLLFATARYQESIKWLSTGDGVFNNDTLINAIYTPGIADIANGEVELVLTGGSQCGTTSDTLRLLIVPFFSIEGMLWFNSQTMEDAVILAVKDTEDAARAIDITKPGNDGYFRFERLPEGRYCLYAIPDTALTNGAVPGYYANNLRWQDAHYFLLDENTFDVDITLPVIDYRLPQGEGSVSGYFAMPAQNLFSEDVFCNSFFDRDNTLDYCNGGLSNITVFLYNSTGDKLLDYTLTDENGNFFFNHLPFGNYIIDAEKAAYLTTVSPVITLSPDHKNETGVVIELSGMKIGIYRTNNTPAKTQVNVYPNPVQQFLNIPVTGNTGETAVITIYNSFGQMVLRIEATHSNHPLQPCFKLNVSSLNAGIYFGRMLEQDATSGFTFVKN